MEKELEKLIKDEIERAINLHGRFNSMHEAHSVLREEIEEIDEEIEEIKQKMEFIWLHIRGIGFGNDSTISDMETIIESANNLITEAIQLTAIAGQLKKQYESDSWK